MSETRRNFWVGLFALVGLGALATLIILFGQAPDWMMRTRAYQINVQFQSAAGIRPGTQVTAGGIEIGRVLKVVFQDPADLNAGASVVLLFNDPFRLRVGSRAETTEPGLGSGRPPIVILPGSRDAGELTSGATIPGRIRPAVESLFPAEIVNTLESAVTQLGSAASALKPVLEDMHGILQQRTPEQVDAPGGPPGNIASAAARLDSTLKNLNVVVGDAQMQGSLKGAIENFKAMSDDGKAAFENIRGAADLAKGVVAETGKVMQKAQDSMVQFDANVSRVSQSAVGGMDQATRLLDQLTQLSQSLARGEGTLGKLLVDPKLYESVEVTFRRLAEAAEEMKLLVKDWQQGKIRVAF
ncbi:MAG: MlaD family protein [Phycisphaerae bacterium]